MASHSAIASIKNVVNDIVEAIRNNQFIDNSKLEALRYFTYQLVEKRGWIDERDLQYFLQAGYENSHLLTILVGITQKP